MFDSLWKELLLCGLGCVTIRNLLLRYLCCTSAPLFQPCQLYNELFFGLMQLVVKSISSTLSLSVIVSFLTPYSTGAQARKPSSSDENLGNERRASNTPYRFTAVNIPFRVSN